MIKRSTSRNRAHFAVHFNSTHNGGSCICHSASTRDSVALVHTPNVMFGPKMTHHNRCYCVDCEGHESASEHVSLTNGKQCEWVALVQRSVVESATGTRQVEPQTTPLVTLCHHECCALVQTEECLNKCQTRPNAVHTSATRCRALIECRGHADNGHEPSMIGNEIN